MSHTEDIAECKQLYKDLCRYSIDKDAAGIASVLTPNYVLIHMTGMQQDRDAYIRAVENGTLNYYSVDHESIDVKISDTGDKAEICGKSRINAAVFGGGRHTWRLQQDLIAEKQNGKWLLTRSEASVY